VVDAPAVALLGAAALHLGFQVTVTTLVYPALVRSPESGWAAAHSRHSRGVTPLVATVYAALVAAATWALLAAPLTPALVLTLAGAAMSLATTAFVAAPLHGRLGQEGPTPALLHRLVVADRVRTAGALVCAAGAVAACLGA
jgi:hypothetical protein